MKRVLVIDDAATLRMFYRITLQGEGIQVEEAVNGIEGLEKALQTPFDLYVVDVNMPKLDGYGFLRELRSLDMPQVPAIMVSTAPVSTRGPMRLPPTPLRYCWERPGLATLVPLPRVADGAPGSLVAEPIT